jgi:hypothetical protein
MAAPNEVRNFRAEPCELFQIQSETARPGESTRAELEDDATMPAWRKRTIGHDIGVGVDPLGRESSHGTRVEQAVCRNKILAAASRLLFKGVAFALFF